jgi:hypothetical protein
MKLLEKSPKRMRQEPEAQQVLDKHWLTCVQHVYDMI